MEPSRLARETNLPGSGWCNRCAVALSAWAAYCPAQDAFGSLREDGTMTIIYRFRSWDISCDQYQISRRWATRERIEAFRGEIVSEGVECPEELIGKEIEGMTDRNFDPRRHPHSNSR
jgi:hypothetical protein